MNTPVQINPLAVLAAVLFHINKRETVTVRADDSAEELQIDQSCVKVKAAGDVVVCQISSEKIFHYMQVPYDFKIRFHNGVTTISFEKSDNKPVILNVNGNNIAGSSDEVKKLIEEL